MAGKPSSRTIVVAALVNANNPVIVLPVPARGTIVRLEVTEVGGTSGFTYAVYESYRAFTPAIAAPTSKYADPVFPGTSSYAAGPAYRASPVMVVAPGSASYAGTQPWDGKYGLSWPYTNRDGTGDTDIAGYLYLHLTPTGTGTGRSYLVNITVCEPGAGPG